VQRFRWVDLDERTGVDDHVGKVVTTLLWSPAVPGTVPDDAAAHRKMPAFGGDTGDNSLEGNLMTRL